MAHLLHTAGLLIEPSVVLFYIITKMMLDGGKVNDTLHYFGCFYAFSFNFHVVSISPRCASLGYKGFRLGDCIWSDQVPVLA